MRYQGIYITGLGAELGVQVPAPGMARRGALALADARRMRQRSVCVAGASGPELAVRSARQAVRGHERDTGARPSIRAHLHATSYGKADFWSAARFVLDQLAATDHVTDCVTDCALVCEIGAMSNGMVLGLELTASLVAGRPDLHTVLLSAGDRLSGPRFSGYGAGHGVHYGVLYGAAGAAMVVSRTPGWARLVSVATCSDTALDGLTRSTPPTTTSSIAGTRIDIGSGQRAWPHSNEGLAEALRRNHLGVVTATAVALADAGIDLDQARWIVTPFLGHEAKRTRWLRPLGIDQDHDDRTLTTLGMHLGHLGAADHVVGLRHLMATDAVDPGDHVVLASASERSAGMTWTTAVLQILAPHHIPDDPHDPGDPDVSSEPDDVSIELARERARLTHQGPAAA